MAPRVSTPRKSLTKKATSSSSLIPFFIQRSCSYSVDIMVRIVRKVGIDENLYSRWPFHMREVVFQKSEFIQWHYPLELG